VPFFRQSEALESGTIRTGDTITVLPTLKATKVGSIKEFQKEPREAEAGKAVGLDIEEDVLVDRGCIFAGATDLPFVTDTIEASLFWMDSSVGRKIEKYTFRCATQEVACWITRIKEAVNTSTLEVTGMDLEQLKSREAAEVIIRTEHPVVVDPFSKVREVGRFVLSRENTVAGGIVRGAGR
jgi:sulfate adenylyltransferase subunit 1 (EFTu-like GTPase family)